MARVEHTSKTLFLECIHRRFPVKRCSVSPKEVGRLTLSLSWPSICKATQFLLTIHQNPVPCMHASSLPSKLCFVCPKEVGYLTLSLSWPSVCETTQFLLAIHRTESVRRLTKHNMLVSGFRDDTWG